MGGWGYPVSPRAGRRESGIGHDDPWYRLRRRAMASRLATLSLRGPAAEVDRPVNRLAHAPGDRQSRGRTLGHHSVPWPTCK